MHVFVSLWWDLILRVSWLISPFLGPCSDSPFCLYSFFSSWVVLHLFRPGAQSLLLHGSFLTVQLSWNLFSSALVIWSVKSSLALNFTLSSFFPRGRILFKYTLV